MLGKKPTKRNSLHIDGYYSKQTTAKETTKTVWRRSKNHLVAFFGAKRLLSSITTGDAKDFRLYLLGTETTDGKPKKPLAENTVRQTCGIAKQFFADAVERGLIDRNPFAHHDMNTSKKRCRTRCRTRLKWIAQHRMQ